MSNWTRTSEVAHINLEAAKLAVHVQDDVGLVLDLAQRIAEESDGAFDISIEPLVRLWGFIGGKPHLPDQKEITAVLRHVGWEKVLFDVTGGTISFNHEGVGIDLGGIAKGYGVDRVAGLLQHAGVTNALINLSGNMFAIGDAPDHGAGQWESVPLRELFPGLPDWYYTMKQ